MNCWLIFFLLIFGSSRNGNCGCAVSREDERDCQLNSNNDCGCMNSRDNNDCGCMNSRDNNDCGCRSNREENRDCGCDNDRRDNDRRDYDRRDYDRRDNDRFGMTTPPWVRAGERDRDDSCGCQNR